MEKQNTNRQMNFNGYNRIRLLAYPFYAVFMYLLFILINPWENFFRSYSNYTIWNYVVDFFSVIGFTAVILETGILITKLLNGCFPWETSPLRRILLQLSLQITTLVILFSVAFYLLPLPPLNAGAYDTQELILRQGVVLGSLVSLLNTAIFTAEHFFREWGTSKIEAMQLKQTATEARLDALTTQIDPHFLFNNLSTLTSLIEEDPAQAVEFVMRFTHVYRYMLSRRQAGTILVKEEIAFINAYLFLYQMRYGHSLLVDVKVDPSIKEFTIAPMTLQLLVENAVKHNQISENRPLHIVIFSEADKWIVVQNNKQQNKGKVSGTGLGLANIRERYVLLGKGEPVIGETESTFTVKIPL